MSLTQIMLILLFVELITLVIGLIKKNRILILASGLGLLALGLLFGLLGNALTNM